MELTNDLVATEIMGWEWFIYPIGPQRFLAPPDTEWAEKATGKEPIAKFNHVRVPNYLGDMNHCMMVVEKKIKDGWSIEMGWDEGWYCNLYDINLDFIGDGVGVTLNENILTAICKAKGVDIE